MKRTIHLAHVLVLAQTISSSVYAQSPEQQQLCADLTNPIAYEVWTLKNQGYTPEDSYQKIAGAFKEAWSTRKKATGPGANIKNEFNERLAKNHIKFIEDAVYDAASRPFYDPDVAYKNYLMRCINEVTSLTREMAKKHEAELRSMDAQ